MDLSSLDMSHRIFKVNEYIVGVKSKFQRGHVREPPLGLPSKLGRADVCYLHPEERL